MCKGHGSTRITSNENYGKKSKVEEFMNNSQEDRPKRNWMSIFSRHIMGTREVPNEDLETDSFTNMLKLKFLLLSNIQLSGCYRKFPKKLRWLFWRYLQLESLPSDFPMGKLVAIDLCYSSLKQLWTAPKVLCPCPLSLTACKYLSSVVSSIILSDQLHLTYLFVSLVRLTSYSDG